MSRLNATLRALLHPFFHMNYENKRTIGILAGEIIFCYFATLLKVNQTIATLTVIGSLLSAVIFCKTSR
jgi:hypothetical protein